jgi:hypothetical protein
LGGWKVEGSWCAPRWRLAAVGVNRVKGGAVAKGSLVDGVCLPG